MDERDFLLLNALRENSRCSLKQLQDKTDLASPTLYKRIQRLFTQGIIRKATVIIDWKKAGFPIHLFFSVEADQNIFQQFIETQKCVNTLFVLRGERQCFFEAYFSSGAEADKFITEMEEKVKPTQIYFWEVGDVKNDCFQISEI
ncbi:MAG: Lrp/AsnC family transcriptional regulator [Nanoarchaeota archaeon]